MDFIYASNEPKSVLARDLGDCRDNLRNSRSVFLVVILWTKNFVERKALLPYRILYVAVAAIAPVVELDLVWLVADTLNALMAIPNIIAVLLLSNVMVADTERYIHNLDAVDDTPVPVVRD